VINQAGLQKNTNNMLDKCMFVHVQIVAGRPKVDFSVTEKKKKNTKINRNPAGRAYASKFNKRRNICVRHLFGWY
jgi:hypothetical protein